MEGDRGASAEEASEGETRGREVRRRSEGALTAGPERQPGPQRSAENFLLHPEGSGAFWRL